MKSTANDNPDRRQVARQRIYRLLLAFFGLLSIYVFLLLIGSLTHFREPVVRGRPDSTLGYVFAEYIWVFGGLFVFTALEIGLLFLGIRWARRWLRREAAKAPAASLFSSVEVPSEPARVRSRVHPWVTAAFLSVMALLAVNSCLLLVLFHRPESYFSQLNLHVGIGFALIGLFVFRMYSFVRSDHPRYMAGLFAFYPFFIIWTVMTPGPLIVILLFNLTAIPLLLYWLYTRTATRRLSVSRRVFLLSHFLLSLTLMSGLFAILDPATLRFAFFYRRIHGFFAIAALLVEGYRLFGVYREKNGRPFPAAAHWQAVAMLLVGLAVAGGAAFTQYKQALLQAEYERHTYPTHAMAEARNLPFREMDIASLEGSAECDQCHPVPYKQWKVSVHAYAARNLSFQKTARALAEKHGKEILRHCAICHDPAVAFTDDPGLLIDPAHLAKSEGVGCRACHYMTATHEKDGAYSVSLPRVDRTFADSKTRARYIFRAVLEHVADNTKPITKDGTSCYACHFLESHRQGQTMTPLDNVTSFVESSLAKRIRCHACHMPRLQTDDRHYSWMDHRMFGIHTTLNEVAIESDEKALAELELFSQEAKQWLSSELKPLDWNSVWFDETFKSYRLFNYAASLSKMLLLQRVTSGGGGFFDLHLQKAAWRNAAEPEMTKLFLSFEARSRLIAHDFPSSLFANISRAWFTLELFDANGQPVASRGTPDDLDNLLGRLEVLPDGTPIEPEQSLYYTDITNKKWIRPDLPYEQQYEIDLPRAVAKPLTAVFSLRYQRYTFEHYRSFTDRPIGEPLQLKQITIQLQ